MAIMLYQKLHIIDSNAQEDIYGFIFKAITTDYFPKVGDLIKDPFFSNGKKIKSIIINSDKNGNCTYEIHLGTIDGDWGEASFRDEIKSSVDAGWTPEDARLKDLLNA